MAILSRRAIQELLDEHIFPQSQLSSLTKRLNNIEQSLAAEWELIILSALSRVGTILHEPSLGGSTQIDFHFEDAGGLCVLGDIAALSDEELERRNAVDAFTKEVHRLTSQRGIKGSLSIHIGSKSNHGKNKQKPSVDLILPPPQLLKMYVFNHMFETFLESIETTPTQTHRFAVRNEYAEVSIDYHPGLWHSTIHHRDHRGLRDIEKNPLFSRLKVKSDQLRKSGATTTSGVRTVVVCDGGTSMFQASSNPDVVGAERVIRHFLQKTNTIDCVVIVEVKERTGWNPYPHFQFGVRVLALDDSGPSNLFANKLTEGLATIPQPVRNPVNAQFHLSRQKTRGLRTLSFSDRQSPSYSVNELTISARAIMGFLAGSIDRHRFEVLTDLHLLELLRKAVDEGASLTDIQLDRKNHLDDDAVVLRWKNCDPSTNPFKVS